MTFVVAMGGVCSAQLFSVTPEQTGKVVHVQGQVSLVKDTVTWALNLGDTIQPKQEIVTGVDGYAKIQVPDGSVFEVFPGSRATFRSNQGNLRELLDLWIGRVKVHVEKLNGKPNPNRIQTPTAVISVRGTIFDVTVEEEDQTLVLVEEGQVAVQHALMPYTSPKLLNSGDYIRVYKHQPLAEKKFDKGNILQGMLKAMRDIWVMQPRTAGGGGSIPAPGPSTVPGGGLPGDTSAPPPPPSLPPPPPPGF
jgi:ferric-dicitrate binding protein FerR (iron transport regulator)